MIKIPRFMKEYANHEIKYYEGLTFMRPEIKEEYINSIKGAVTSYQNGLITLSETMSVIGRPLYR